MNNLDDEKQCQSVVGVFSNRGQTRVSAAGVGFAPFVEHRKHNLVVWVMSAPFLEHVQDRLAVISIICRTQQTTTILTRLEGWFLHVPEHEQPERFCTILSIT